MKSIKTIAIPFAFFPYSSTSRIVHWQTRHHGKLATLLKGALRPKSHFLGEYELFSTTELLYLPRPGRTLHLAQECSMLHTRNGFRTQWRAMQTASALSALFDRNLPEEAPDLTLFEFYEELLDLAETYGNSPQFFFWAELQVCSHLGHAPHFEHCIFCQTPKPNLFCISSGGSVCSDCAQLNQLQTIPLSPDIRAMLQVWQKHTRPQTALKTRLTSTQHQQILHLLGAFLQEHLNLPEKIHQACIQQ